MKKSSIICMVISLFALSVLWTSVVMAQATDKPVTLATILKAAGVPLTADQDKKLKDIDITQGRAAFRDVMTMFTEKQTEALKAALGSRPGRNNGPETPRYINQLIILEKAACPLTEKQVAALKALPNEQGSNQKVMDLLTDKQKEAYQKAFPPRQ